ncbi:hypothetical protein Tco_0775686 [Tanacetum coccineum]
MSTSSLQAEKTVYTSLTFTHCLIHTITQDNQNRDLDLRRKEEKSLIYNTSFLGEYECSSLALDRRRKKVDPDLTEILGFLEKFGGGFEQDIDEQDKKKKRNGEDDEE